MSLLKTLSVLSAALILAACGQESSSTASEPAAASQAPAELAASAASQAASEPQTQITAANSLTTLEQAKWQDFACEDGKTVKARYFQSKNGPSAQIKFNSVTVTAPHSPELSNEDLHSFSDGEYTWTITNFGGPDLYLETDGFLIHHEQAGTGEDSLVDNVLVQGCMPKS